MSILLFFRTALTQLRLTKCGKSLLRACLWVIKDNYAYFIGLSTLLLVVIDLWIELAHFPFVSLEFAFHVFLALGVLLMVRYSIKLDHSARYDGLTGLVGRQHFLSRLSASLGERDANVVLLLMDLDRFKFVNDTLGHAAGDELLKIVAQKFRSSLRESDIISRLGGDEFAVIINSPKSTKTPELRDRTIEEVCRRLHEAFHGQISLNEYEVDIGVSVGVAVYPEHATTPQDLLRCADVAMYVAKRSKSGCSIYDRSSDPNSVESLLLVGSIRSAIDQDQFTLFYQLQKSLKTNKIEEVEALIRWNHPTLGLLGPDRFIPLCEHSGIMRHITNWVIRAACKQVRLWRDQGITLRVSINISATDLAIPTLLPTVVEALTTYQLVPSDIVLEITETAVVSDMETAAAVTATLSSIGIKLSIDDYGTGHTSLNYLRHLPISQIKIDKSFITGILSNTDDYLIVQSTIQLAHELGYEVVAEGVETKDIHDLLLELGCDRIQGYYLSKPLPPSKIDSAFLERTRSLT